MDLGTIGGLLTAAIIFGWVMFAGDSGNFYEPTSILIVIGGTVAALFINFSPAQVLSALRLAAGAFRQPRFDEPEIIRLLVSLAEKARREGLLAMEEEAEALDDEFLRKGIQLVVDGTEPELVRNVLEIELGELEGRHRVGWRVFEAMGTYAPALGMIGTLIGLIKMLGTLDNPDMIGAAMAIALITTLYGALLANVVFLPIAGKIRVRSAQEMHVKEIMLEGTLSIQAGENPRIVGEKLSAFLAPEQRAQMEEVASGRESATLEEAVTGNAT